MILCTVIVKPASSPTSLISTAHASEEVLENGLDLFRTDILRSSSSSSVEPSSELIEDILIFKSCIGIFFCGSCLIIHFSFGFV